MPVRLIVCHALVVAGVCLASPPAGAKRAHDLDAVPAPCEAEIRKILIAENWTNPYIMVLRDGFELILYGQPRTDKVLTLAEIELILLDLPPERWPLGKVVAVQEISLRGTGDDEKIRKNLNALEFLLQRHKVRIDRWPSG